ncbi:MAG: hypothetical protein HOH20_04230 [Rhodospirillaceae bacterium]|jgi:methionyl-tRNA formyltransferase|nr:hypothetical protein [Rhodospirillaceae bacterium]MBT5240080.1 hypothetical protein [Rhodospirillaceae bacterium]MBT5564757.1 hypothetical protein [Rhodospirillaceae bacterium]MBT6088765.1 hypothetical protein [Rhodospirillaceae bacterium]
MDHQTLIILTEPLFQPALLQAALSQNGADGLNVEPVDTLDALIAALDQSAGPVRLAAFCSGIIVPPGILSRIDAGAYNFHPGPPEYPGLFPSCFAIYEDAETFGATAHLMTDKIDKGEIVGVEHFAMQKDSDRMTLDKMALECVLQLYHRLLPHLVKLDAPITPSGEVWLGRPRSTKDFKALCELPDDVTADEFDKRYRAVGEGPNHALTITLFGQRFKLDNSRTTEDVVRGGLPTT